MIPPGTSDPFPPPLHFMGLRFWNGSSDALLQRMDETGGILAVPSAPSLAQAADDPLLMKAYRSAEWSVMDGGYVALIVRLLGRRINRISGLQLIEKILAAPGSTPVEMRDRKMLWVVPNTDERSRIEALLENRGFPPGHQVYYEAPYYRTDPDFEDQALLSLVTNREPDWIVLCLGGGRQEKLGYFLGRIDPSPKRKPVILCTGAAIAFFSGGQASIPKWADRLYLGWLFRILQKPTLFIPRYIKALWHFPMAVWHHRWTLFNNVTIPSN